MSAHSPPRDRLARQRRHLLDLSLESGSNAILRRIVSFDLDEESHWRAKLDCGHHQHVRHDPPLISRPWVLTEQGRASHLGMTLNCLRCDAGEPVIEAAP